MEQTITVTITKTIRVHIDDAHLTPECTTDFSAAIFPISCSSELIKHAAQMVARNGDCFVEGIGQASQGDKSIIRYKIEDEWIDSEVISTHFAPDDLTFNPHPNKEAS